MKAIFQKISDKWFLNEPLMFSILCKHSLEENKKMAVRFRSGKMRIEYNSDRISSYSFEEIEEYLKIEIIRILLKHPYQRQPYMGRKDAIAIASDITISENWNPSVFIHNSSEFNLGPDRHFEEYYYAIAEIFRHYESPPNDQSPNNDDILINDNGGKELNDNDDSTSRNGNQNNQNQNDGKQNDGKQVRDEKNESTISNQNSQNQNNGKQLSNEKIDTTISNQKENDSSNKLNDSGFDINLNEESEKSELWEDDDLASETINDLIDIAEKSKHWGSISGKLIESIKASQFIQINYREILNRFKTSILSNQRKLTRFKPSRRYGFQFMGAKYDFCTNILVAIDVSGSVTSQKISNFLSVINQFFKYGIKSIDVIQFDTSIKGKVLTLKKASSELKISGRGGTDFQEIFDFVEETKYDGLIIFTDGYAQKPIIKNTRSIRYLWVLEDIESYNSHKIWMLSLPKTQVTWLPYHKNQNPPS
jgi:predicted metal-dependent peptidase